MVKTRCKLKKNRKSNDDDSGVSLESKDLEARKSVEMNKEDKPLPAGTPEVTNNNFKISLDLNNIRKCLRTNDGNQENLEPTLGSIKSNIAPSVEDRRSERSALSFDQDDQSCLDYEPSDEEIEDYVDSPDSSLHLQFEFPEPFCEPEEVLDDTNLNKSNQVDDTESNHNDAGYWEDSVQGDEDKATLEESDITDQNGNESNANVFKNVAVNFTGSNITITRPVINNEVKILQNLPVSEDPSLLKDHQTPRIREQVCKKRKRKWPQSQVIDTNLIKITSNDDIFMYNISRNVCLWSSEGALSICSHSDASSKDFSDFEGEVYDQVLPDLNDDNIAHATEHTLVGPNKCPERNTNQSSSSERSYASTFSDITEDNFTLTNASILNRPQKISDRNGQKQFLKRPFTASNESPKSLHIAEKDPDVMSIHARSSISDSRSDISQASESDRTTEESDKESFVARWLNDTNVSIKTLLESLCELHFTSACNNRRCTKSHSTNEVQTRIKHLSPKDVMDAYKLVVKKDFWYENLFDVFITCFKSLTDFSKLSLVDMISDVYEVFRSAFMDKTSYVLRIVEALVSLGLTFTEAVNMIILRHGTSQLWINDILLFIISKNANLDKHWCLVRKLICFRREQIDHEVVINLLNEALNNYPPNVDLCNKIFNEIIDKDLVDADKIPEPLWASIRMARPSNNTFQRTPHAMELELNSRKTQSKSYAEQTPFYSPPQGDYRSRNERHSKNMHISRGSPLGACSEEVDDLMRDNGLEEKYRLFQTSDSVFSSSSDSRKGRSIPQENFLFGRPVRIDGDSTFRQSMSLMQNSNGNATNDDNMWNIGDIVGSQETYTRNCDQDIFKKPTDYVPRRRARNDNFSNTLHTSNGRVTKQQSTTAARSGYNNEVLRKINASLNMGPKQIRPETPANTIAHPTRQPSINPRYSCNISLHNICPGVQVNASEITNSDLHKLRAMLSGRINGQEFLNLLAPYQDSFTIENFILNTLTLMKSGSESSNIFTKFQSLICAIGEVDPNYMKKPHLKMFIEVLAMNLIYFLEMKGKWELCRNILLVVKDWHSLVTSKIFFSNSHMMTHMHRYIYLIMVLIRAGDFVWVNEIFQLQALNLLGPISKWPYQYVPSDEGIRNQALELFFEEGFTVHIFAVNDLLKHITVILKGRIDGFDVWKLFGNKLCETLDAGGKNSSIPGLLFRDILNYYGDYMSNAVLQSYLIYMEDELPGNEALRFFRLCCKRGVYHRYTGQECVIVIRTTMSDFEISSLLECFFENIINRSVAPHDFYIELRLPDAEQPRSTQILKNRLNRSVFKVFESIVNILKTKYKINVNQNVEAKILVTKQMQLTLL